MYNKGDRVVFTKDNWDQVPKGTLGTVVSHNGVRWDSYKGYDDRRILDYHGMHLDDIEPYHQEVPYDPEQMLVEEDDL